MTTPQKNKKVTSERIYRAVASSSAIETGTPTQVIENRLKANTSKYSHLSLAQ